MKFNLDDYKGNYCMHCKTMEEAENFCQVLNRNGKVWSSGDRYTKYTNWDVYQSQTVYYFNKGTFGDIDLVQENQVTILKWHDFMNDFNADCVICNSEIDESRADELWDLAREICDDIGITPNKLVNGLMAQDCIYSNIRDYLEKSNYCSNCGRKYK